MNNQSVTSPPASPSTSAPAVPAASVAAAQTSESLGVVPSAAITSAVATASSSRQVAPWEREREAKRARLADIRSQLEELMEERNALVAELEKLDRAHELATHLLNLLQ